MDVYRKKPLPVIYTQLGFVRKSGLFIRADCPEDLPDLQKLQTIVAGAACVSEIEWSYGLFVKLTEIPDSVPRLDGTSDAVIQWRVFYWKLGDAESLVTDSRPAEAVPLMDAGISTNFLESLAHPISCLPMLRQTGVLFEGDTN